MTGILGWDECAFADRLANSPIASRSSDNLMIRIIRTGHDSYVGAAGGFTLRADA
jgi:hypothetical protein